MAKKDKDKDKLEKMEEPQAADPAADPGNIVVVTFNAGTGIIGVNQNPVVPARLQDGQVRVTWDLTAEALPPGFRACFGNIVLSDYRDRERVAEDGEIEVKTNDALNQWSWTYAPKGEKPLEFEVQYDIFCVFGHEEVVGSQSLAEEDPVARRHHQRKVLSLRQTMGMDPSMATPPGG